MKCFSANDSITITGVRDLDLEQTLDCGQSFRWTKQDDGSFSGVAFGKYVNISLDGTDMIIKNADEQDRGLWRGYFDLDLDYGKIREGISAIHPVLTEAAKYAPGIRILRQEPYEALCTFIISQNNNIKRIKGIVGRLCESFGDEIEEGVYAFPTAEKLASLTPEDLAPLRAGFRNRYIIDSAKKVASGEVDLDLCRTAGYEAARAELMKITGVGVKVADCTLLFGMHRIEAFPIDVWMKRAMEKLFPQQYIFHYSRMHPELFNE